MVRSKPLLVGRNEEKLAEIAAKHGIQDFTTDLDAALAWAQKVSEATGLDVEVRPAPNFGG